MNIELIWYFTHKNIKYQFIEQFNNRFERIDPLMFINSHIMFMDEKLKQTLDNNSYKHTGYSLETFCIDPKGDAFNSSDKNDDKSKYSDPYYQHVINCNSIYEFIDTIKLVAHNKDYSND